jgi:type I restriction enzyme S subunit
MEDKNKEKIPKGWKKVRLGELCVKIKSGGTPQSTKKEFYTGNILFVMIEDITSSKKYLNDTIKHITEEALKSCNAWLIPKFSILYSIYATLGEAVINTKEVSTNQAILGIIPNNKIDTEFLYYILIDFKRRIEQYTIQTTQKNLNLKIVEKFEFIIPETPQEQSLIASILSKVDEAIEQTERIIEKHERIKKGLMQDLIYDNPDKKKVKIKDCCEILDHKRIPLNSEERAKIQGNIPYYGANGIQDWINKFIFDEPLILLAEDGGNFEQYETKPIAYRVYGKSWVNNHAHVLKAKKGFNQDLIFYSLVHRNILYYIKGGTRSKLNRKELEEIEIDVPKEQDKIATILNHVFETIEKEKQQLEKLKKLKSGLMQDLLTGMVRVNHLIKQEAVV